MDRRDFINAAASTAAGAAATMSSRAGIAAGGSRLSGVRTVLKMEAGPGNPRNSEGDFIRLKDGTIWFAYGHFTDRGHDAGHAYLAYRSSTDNGLTWSSEKRLTPEDEDSAKCVSFLRLSDNRIALFCLRDLRPQGGDADGVKVFPVVRFSDDEGESWTEPVPCAHDEPYLGGNNDRVIQLSSGRVLLPVTVKSGSVCYYSDDSGLTFKRSRTTLSLTRPYYALQEPGVVELRDGRVLMFMRTRRTRQFYSYSSDGGETWSRPLTSTVNSPLSPASIERIPSTGDLLLVHNDNSTPWLGWELLKRSPFNVAVSRDEGLTWTNSKIVYDDPKLWYCYTAADFTEIDGKPHVLLGHVASSGQMHERLADEWITLFPVEALYE